MQIYSIMFKNSIAPILVRAKNIEEVLEKVNHIAPDSSFIFSIMSQGELYEKNTN